MGEYFIQSINSPAPIFLKSSSVPTWYVKPLHQILTSDSCDFLQGYDLIHQASS